VTHFIGQRKFRELLFRNGLPWVMVFDGLDGPDDGTVVVVGDIGDEFGHINVVFRTVRSYDELRHEDELRTQLAALGADRAAERAALRKQIDAYETRTACTMTIAAEKRFGLYDFYGNPVPPRDGKIVVPLDHRGYFLRGDGSKGSFAALLAAIRSSRVDGFEPLHTACRDMLAPVPAKPTVRLELTNVLNRPVKGRLSVTLGELEIAYPRTLSFKANETKSVVVNVTGGTATENNTYPLALRFDAGDGLVAVHEEDMHVNLVSRRTITVDGSLDDWRGAIPQTVAASDNAGPTLTEAAWLPFQKYDTTVMKGFATGFVAYDDAYFYFAAKIADDTPHEGMPRYETWDEDEYFYPEVCYAMEKGASGRDATNFSVRWTGYVKARRTGKHTFWTRSDDGIRVWVAGRKLIDNWTGHGDTWDSGRVDLESGKLYPIKVEFFQGGGGATLQLCWEAGAKRAVVPAGALFVDEAGTKPGLAATYYKGADLKKVAQERVDANIDFMDWPGRVDDPDFAAPVQPEKAPLRWPEGVRIYSYRKGPVLPAGNAPDRDNVQIAFNVLSDEEKPWYPCPPGTLKGYTGYACTVAPRYGGGVEIWRLRAPNMPHKHNYPHNFKSPYDGPVRDGKLVTVHEGTTRITECAIPWRELPYVKEHLDTGKTIKFSFRVNDSAGGGTMELARMRSVARRNGSFYVDWKEHWANELEFAFEGTAGIPTAAWTKALYGK